jgi:hypothetical protein
VVLGYALVGCGGGGSAQRLSAAERARVTQAQRAVQRYCVEVGRFIAGKRPAPGTDDLAEATSAVDRLAPVVRDKPDAPYESGRSVRDLVADMAEGLDASDCSPVLRQRLEQELGP